jgi:hypothetical protein
MSNSAIPMNDAPNQVYGFLCQKTNVFYAFESYETYTQFLEWLQRENSLPCESDPQFEQKATGAYLGEDEQLAYAELATDEIMQVFEDPVFEAIDQ